MASNKGHLGRDLIGGSLQIHDQTVLDKDANLTVRKVKIDGDRVEFSQEVGPDYCPCVIHRYRADAAIAQNRILKVGDTDFRLREVDSTDDDETGVIGISVSSAAQAGDVVRVCTGGVFQVEMESNTAVTRGDRLLHSSSLSGRATTTDSSVGTFGIALESAEPGSPGPVIKGAFIKSENY